MGSESYSSVTIKAVLVLLNLSTLFYYIICHGGIFHAIWSSHASNSMSQVEGAGKVYTGFTTLSKLSRLETTKSLVSRKIASWARNLIKLGLPTFCIMLMWSQILEAWGHSESLDGCIKIVYHSVPHDYCLIEYCKTKIFHFIWIVVQMCKHPPPNKKKIEKKMLTPN